ncbi:MAG: hypothetical protein U0271_15785 [Polyangiaceae bacterium]
MTSAAKTAKASVLGVGAATSAGATARLTMLGLRADSVTSDAVPTPEGSTIRVRPAASPVELPTGDGRARAFRLAASALAEAWVDACVAFPDGRLQQAAPPLLFAAPPSFFVGGAPGTRLNELATLARVRVDAPKSLALPGGRAAFGAVLARAFAMLRERPTVIVGAADSLVDAARIAPLREAGRVVARMDRERPNAGSLDPGEGAAFFVLSAHDPKSSASLATLGEPTAKRLEGGELEKSLAELLGELAGDHAEVALFTDANGETERGLAWGRAVRSLTAGPALQPAVKQAAAMVKPPPRIEDLAVALTLGDTDVAGAAIAGALAVTMHAAGLSTASASIVAVLEDQTAVGFTVESAPSPDAPAASSVAKVSGVSKHARTASRALARALLEYKRVKHRIARRSRAPLEASLADLRGALFELEIAPPGEATHGIATRAADGATAVARVARELADRIASSEQPREVAVDDLASLGEELARLLVSARELALREAALLPLGPAATELERPSRVPVVLSRGVPSVFPYTYRKTAPAFDDLEGGADDDEDEDEEPESSALAPTAPSTDAPVEPPVAEKLGDDSIAREIISSLGSAWRGRAPTLADARWFPSLADSDDRLLVELDRVFATTEPLSTRAASLHPELAAELCGAGGPLEGLRVDVVPILAERPSPFDPEGAFARAFVLACSSDPRMVRSAAALARGAHPDLTDAITDALALGSNPELDRAIVELLLDDDEATLAIVLEVERRRRCVSVGGTAPLLFHSSDALRARAARALGVARDRDAAILALETRLASERSVLVRATLFESLAALGAPHSEDSAARAFAELVPLGRDVEPDARAARLLLAHVCAARGRANEVLAMLNVAESPLELESVGWFGRAIAVDPLVKLLRATPVEPELDAHRRAIARALTRITGAELDSPPPGVNRGGVERPRTLAQPVRPMVTVPDDDDLELDPRAWETFWLDRGGGFGSGTKYRFGERYEPVSAARELVAHGVRVRDRELVSREFVLSSERGASVPADTSDWVLRQLAAVNAQPGAR